MVYLELELASKVYLISAWPIDISELLMFKNNKAQSYLDLVDSIIHRELNSYI